jgi:sugar lactone lactonase YvrE
MSISPAVAVDAAGDIFAAANGGITKFTHDSWAATTFGRVDNAGGVAVDGAGNIYASDRYHNVVLKINPDTNTQTTVGEGLNQPLGVAVDKWGNIFISDSENNRVVKVDAVTGAQTTLLGGFTDGMPNVGQPAEITVDGAENIFVADQINEAVWEFPKGNAHHRTVAGDALIPTGVAVDAAGDVFVADSVGYQILEFPAGGGAVTFPVYLIDGPYALALDGAGNLFIAQQDGTLSELKASKPLPLNFGKVAVGSTSEPQYVSIQNAGNRALTAVLPGLVVGPDFLQMAPNGTSPGCTDNFSLSPGEACNVGISFIPQVPVEIIGWALFIDNALNENPTTQRVKLKGTGVQ